jgi:ABC-type hemin transport system substrate-binding protein
VYLAVAGRGVTLAGLRQSKATRGLPAVRNRRFSLVDSGALTDTGPRVVTEVRDLAHLLHPSLHVQ